MDKTVQSEANSTAAKVYGLVFAGCAATLTMAGTIRLLMWMFG